MADRRATSLERILGRAVRCEEVRNRLAFHFGDVFQREMVFVTSRQLDEVVAGIDLPPEPLESARAQAEAVKESWA